MDTTVRLKGIGAPCLQSCFKGPFTGNVKVEINSVCERTLNHQSGFPLGLENLEKWEGIFQSGKSQGILNRLEKSGKITQNTGKLREFEINII